jgi:hypothetical protein
MWDRSSDLGMGLLKKKYAEAFEAANSVVNVMTIIMFTVSRNKSMSNLNCLMYLHTAQHLHDRHIL